MSISFIDIHCHLLPGIDDGAKDWHESLAMARLAVEDGTTTIIATPHQLGNFGHNRGDEIRQRVIELQSRLEEAGVPLQVLPGADVRIEPGMVERLVNGDVLTLADQRRHVLLELPHDVYLPLGPVLEALARHNMVGVLSHPERNEGILRKPDVLAALVDAGCLLQITAGSLCGTFGPSCRELSESLLAQRLVQFVASDGHGVRSRRPLMRRAFEKIIERTNEATAVALCSTNPRALARGMNIMSERNRVPRPKRGWSTSKSCA